MGLQELKNQAEERVAYRGHELGQWRPGSFWQRQANNECRHCGKWVQVDTEPSPNGIDIGGPAVALNCGGGNFHENLKYIARQLGDIHCDSLSHAERKIFEKLCEMDYMEKSIIHGEPVAKVA
ncbi:MAG: hypothetical protein DWQ19_12790 [Crenarchaeota archaeon]|nr:MAG: hypothetical protein DWQ19_12790 [Thermoproteota archaeon]